MEPAGGGQLWCWSPTSGDIQEEKAYRLFRQIVCAVHYCHEKAIMHIGQSQRTSWCMPGETSSSLTFAWAPGSCLGRRWTSFEVLSHTVPLKSSSGKNMRVPSADIWSLGVTLYLMVTGICSFRVSTTTQLKKLIVSCRQSTCVLACVRGSTEPHLSNTVGRPHAEAHHRAGNGASMPEPGRGIFNHSF